MHRSYLNPFLGSSLILGERSKEPAVTWPLSLALASFLVTLPLVDGRLQGTCPLGALSGHSPSSTRNTATVPSAASALAFF